MLDEVFEDETLIFDTVAEWDVKDSFGITYSTSYISRDLLVSRDSSVIISSVSKEVTPSNLRDTTDLEQVTHELSISSSDDSVLRWLAGMFYSDVERDYSQRLPTPSYTPDSRDSYIYFPDSIDPYTSDLTYDLKQTALFGEVTYTLLDRLDLTAGLRWYDWEEDKTFRSGGPFSNSTARSSVDVYTQILYIRIKCRAIDRKLLKRSLRSMARHFILI